MTASESANNQRSLFGDDETPTSRAGHAPTSDARSRWPRACARARWMRSSGRSICSPLGAPCAAAIDADHVPSMILWGPPGSGKTTLAQSSPSPRGTHFIALSAVTAGVADLRRVVEDAAKRLRATRPTARSSSSTRSTASTRRSRTPSCPTSSGGIVTLIGATTENPSLRGQRRAALAQPRLHAAAPSPTTIVLASCCAARSTDAERGLGARKGQPPTRMRCLPRRTCQRRRAHRPQRARAGRQTSRRPDDGGSRRHHPAARRGRRAAPRAALRQGRRGALQHHLRAPQIDARLRPRRRPLLAGAHAGGRRGPALHRAPPDPLRHRGRRHGRSAGAASSASPRSRRSTSSACPKGNSRSPRPSSISPRRPRATRSTPPTRRVEEMCERRATIPCRCTCATRRRG